MVRAPSKKEQTRKRILDAASREFRSKGYAGIGVDGIAKTAGVTSGALYAHFGSKDGAFDAALATCLDEVIEAIPKYQTEHGGNWIHAFVDYYLGQTHRDDLAGGCAMTSLSPEVVRSGCEVQASYEAKMLKIVDLIAAGLDADTTEAGRERAWAVLGALIGGLTIARAVHEPDLARKIAASIRLSSLNAAGKTRNVNIA